MSKAEELLNSNSVAVYSSDNVETEPHIVIDKNRNVTVPDELKRIAVQHDHMIETVTFDCPRYWDKHDMSKMYIYVNYMRADGEKGSDLATNVTIDETDDSIMHFDWTITGHLSAIQGNIVFLVCTQKMADDGTAENHWNSELNTDMYVSEGLEVDSDISAVYPGIITQLLTRMDNVDSKTTDDAMAGYVDHYINNSQTSVESIVSSNLAANGGTYFGNYMDTDPTGADLMQDCVDKHLAENGEKYFSYNNLLDTILGSEYASTNSALLGGNITNLTVGDSFTIPPTDYVQSLTGYRVFQAVCPANSIIDFRNGKYPRYNVTVKTTETYFKMFVVSYKDNKIIDIVDYDYLREAEYYRCSEKCRIYFTTEVYFDDANTIFEIREYIGFAELNDIAQMKEDIASINNPIIKSYLGSDIRWKNKYLNGVDELNIGDQWLGFSALLLDTANNQYVVSVSMSAGQTLDFSNGCLPEAIHDGYGKLIVTKNSNPGYIADIVDFDTLKLQKTYYCEEASVIYYCSEINFLDTDCVFDIRQSNEYRDSITLVDSADTSKRYKLSIINGEINISEVS